MVSGKRKGSQFERDFCHALGEWWCGRSDVFWRTQGSGARATVRHKKGQRTEGQYGDICAVDPIGLPLTRTIVFSLKTGYPGNTPFDLLDKKKSLWLSWIREARQFREQANCSYWMIVAKRQRNLPFVVFPNTFWNMFDIYKPKPHQVIVIKNFHLILMMSCDFFSAVKPESIIKWDRYSVRKTHHS